MDLKISPKLNAHESVDKGYWRSPLITLQNLELRENLQSVFRKVRSRYGVAYSPSNKRKDGQYRRIRMEVSRNSPYVLRNLTIHGPQGYFAPLEIFQH